jgi:hypothetical protein
VLLATEPHHNPSGRERCAMAGRTYQKGHSATSLVSRARLRSRQRSERWEWLAVELGCSGGEDGGCDGARKVCVVEGGLEGRQHMAGQARPTGAERILDKLDHSQPFGKETQGRPHYVHLQTTVYLFFIPSSMPESFTFASQRRTSFPVSLDRGSRTPRSSWALVLAMHPPAYSSSSSIPDLTFQPTVPSEVQSRSSRHLARHTSVSP